MSLNETCVRYGISDKLAHAGRPVDASGSGVVVDLQMSELHHGAKTPQRHACHGHKRFRDEFGENIASIELPLNHEKISTRSRAVDVDRFDNCGGVCGNSIGIYIAA
jgi:hypothetical protein